MTRLLRTTGFPLEEFDTWLSIMKDVQNTMASGGKNQVPKINAYRKLVKIPHEEKDLGSRTVYCIDAAIPYAKKEDIDVQIEDNVLSIVVDPHQDTDVTDGQYLIREIPRGLMKRFITLGELINTESAVSTFENGVLHIEFDEAEPKSKRIAIN